MSFAASGIREFEESSTEDDPQEETEGSSLTKVSGISSFGKEAGRIEECPMMGHSGVSPLLSSKLPGTSIVELFFEW